MRFFVTGTAGFIGFNVARRLLTEGNSVFGIDGFTPYYDQTLKRRRHDLLTAFPHFTGREVLLENAAQLRRCVAEASADVVLHFAAQAGVRYSSEQPQDYINSNIVGTFNLLDAIKHQSLKHLVIASTSSVYGANRDQPFSESHPANQPVSLYAATKIAMEALAFSYAANFHLPTTAARLFTAYGPWGRPDMALFKFTKNILEGQPIDVFGFGKMTRDFTYVDDIVEAIVRLAALPPMNDTTQPLAPTQPDVPYRAVNIGCGQPVGLERFIALIESEVGRKAIRRDLPMQAGDVPSTWADTARLEHLTDFRPATPVAQGVHEFVVWYRDYYRC